MRWTLRLDADIVDLAVAPDGARVAVALTDRTLRLVDARRGREVFVVHGHRIAATSVAWSPDGTTLLSGDGAREEPRTRIRIWRAE